ncbi:MAG TPA: OB-fold nucleic acid binding domain-containing protein, partial [Candidatus Limnocylindrales bacterium]
MVVVLGQPGARIPNTALTAGRIAEIVGIVRPAYPTASDKRPSILPRSAADVRQTGGGASDPVAKTSTGTKPTASSTGAALTSAADGVADADLVDLATLVGATVRVGGLVVDLTDDGFTLDDGTATGRVVLTGTAADLVDLVEPGDAINATGRVGEVTDAGPVVIVDDPANLVLGSALDSVDAGAGPSPDSSYVPATQPDATIAAFTDATGVLPGAGAGIAGLLAIGAASVAMTMLRRRHGRRLLAARVATRLALITGASRATQGDDPARNGSPSVD